MDYSSSDNKLLSKKNLISYLILAIIILAIPLLVSLVQRQTQLKPKAAANEVTFPELSQDASGNFVSKSPRVKIQLSSPFGPATPQSQTR